MRVTTAQEDDSTALAAPFAEFAALCEPRIFRIRDDKAADEADTLDTLRALFARQSVAA